MLFRICIIFFVLCIAFSLPFLLIGGLYLHSIPSRYETHPPYTQFNEGGDLCFRSDSIWSQLNQSHVSDILDGNRLGGNHPKLILNLTHETHRLQSLWKPQLFHTQTTHEYIEWIFNEIVAFHLDCLLQLQRVPPTTFLQIPTQQFCSNLSPNTLQQLTIRNFNCDNFDSKFIAGVAQQYLDENPIYRLILTPPIENLLRSWCCCYNPNNLDSWRDRLTYSLCGETTTSIREKNQRDMFDFLIGNADRSKNRFYSRVNNQIVLLYLDNDVIALDGDFHNYKPINLQNCKFNWKVVKRLGMETCGRFGKDGCGTSMLGSVLQKSIFEREGIVFNDFNVWDRIDDRTLLFLNHVGKCLEIYGWDETFVF